MAIQKKHKDSLFWGFILVALGGLLLLENFDVDVFQHLARLWPLILIAWGGWKLVLAVSERKERKPEIPGPGEK